MNARHKKFILNKLIPFILREQGRGFGMDDWKYEGDPGEIIYFDDIGRKIPVCGSVCCIGGSIQTLKNIKKRVLSRDVAPYIGLSSSATRGLFMNWEWRDKPEPDEEDGRAYGWPKNFTKKYEKATTPYRKAQVAVSLLKEVVKTNGECLRLD